MSRALRVGFAGAIYHIMSRGVARMKTFLDDGGSRVSAYRGTRQGGQNRGHLGAPSRVSSHENDPADLARQLLEQAAQLGNPPAMLEAARQLLEQATRPRAPLRIAEGR